jgi:hypothetical protein
MRPPFSFLWDEFAEPREPLERAASLARRGRVA